MEDSLADNGELHWVASAVGGVEDLVATDGHGHNLCLEAGGDHAAKGIVIAVHFDCFYSHRT